MNFDQSPMLVIWEATQACDLACVHCRASAQSERSDTELTTEQGYRLLDEIRSFGEPLMVFTGGDPLKRPDLFDLIRYSVKIGLRTNVTLNRSAVRRFSGRRNRRARLFPIRKRPCRCSRRATPHCSSPSTTMGAWLPVSRWRLR